MLYWIFDLDYTLYQMPYKKKFNYNLLRNDPFLNKLLKKLPLEKIIFTN